MRLALVVLLSVVALGCANKRNAKTSAPEPSESTTEQTSTDIVIESEPAPPTDPFVYYERTHCFGTCPVFVFTMNYDGTCYYEGRNFVDRIGSYKAQAPDALTGRIRDAAQRVNYFELDSLYDEPMLMDLPAVITKIDGKEVVLRYNGPDLRSLYTLLDEAIEEMTWEPFRR